MLTSKISCLLLASLAFLLGALLVMPSQGHTWAAFQNKHIDNRNQYPPRGLNLYCKNLMRYRGLTYTFCKTFNTFIFQSANVIQSLCRGIWDSDSVSSRDYFNLVDCKYTSGSAPNNCNYQGNSVTKHIVITCEKYLPVHYNYSVW